MATTKKPVTEVGVIGQMYENRKSKKVGVLESRNEKFKTLLMRDNEGKSFNINFSTFRSDWRKYQGDEVIQTSTQVEETKAVEKQKEEKAKKVVEESKKVVKEKSETVKISTEEKVKRVRATDTVISDKIKSNAYALKTERNSKGGIIIRCGSKKTKFVDVWCKYATDSYEFVLVNSLYDANKKELEKLVIATKSEYLYRDKWVMKHQFKVSSDRFEQFVDELLKLVNDASVKLIESKDSKKKKTEEDK